MNHGINLIFVTQLRKKFESLSLYRPLKKTRYFQGETLSYQARCLLTNDPVKITLQIIKYVGGGFAGQVYQIKITDIEGDKKAQNSGLRIGQCYALKIMIPPTGFSRFFRNIIYRIGFLASFQPQVNPDAARVSALWQKLIRRGAKVAFKREGAVNDIHLVFVDETLGSCGEISDWVEGRTWKLEVDDQVHLLKKRYKKIKIDKKKLGSLEYREKKKFMSDLVTLLHQMGAYEFARQYEWSTCKSQPNCLKLIDEKSGNGLVAVDFKAGLALLPFLPMSPGDFKLILKGIFRGSLVQFDRGNLKKLAQFIENHNDQFEDLKPHFEELKAREEIYRNSAPDITHNLLKYFYSKKFYTTLYTKTIEGWRIRNLTEDKIQDSLKGSILFTMIFYLLGIIPLLGRFVRKLWGSKEWRKHFQKILTSFGYLKRSFRGKGIEKSLKWYQESRISQKKAERISSSLMIFICYLPLSILPRGLFKFFTDFTFFKERLSFIFLRPIKLYFNRDLRTQWLKDMIREGENKKILNHREASKIVSQLKEPFIQKYLKSLAVHICTLPVTQIVSILVSFLYVKLNPQLTVAQATAAVAGILVLFQITPISPGSLVRGFYVIGLMIKDRNFKDYRIAVFLSFFKYIGYLAFPIQMTYRYPELSRFMAGHWATEAVHIVPVFGEPGALLEHFAFRLFYNWPLTIRRRMREVKEIRQKLKSRYVHLPVLVLISSVILSAYNFSFYERMVKLPLIKDMWGIGILLALVFGAGISWTSKGNNLKNRILLTIVWGICTGIISKGILLFSSFNILVKDLLVDTTWWIFLFIIFALIGLIFKELLTTPPIENLPDHN